MPKRPGRIYGEIPQSWDGQWTLVILPPATGSRRQTIRDELRWLGFGQVSPGVFAHPNWSLERARTWLAGLDLGGDGLLLKSTSEGIDADRRLVASGWDLGDLTRRYRRFVDTFTPVAATVSAAAGIAAQDAPSASNARSAAAPSGHHAIDPAAAFLVRTLLIHEYRKIHLQDPLLPPALLPADWVGAAAYELSRRLYAAVFPSAERYLSNTASTIAAPLPPATDTAHARFGGLANIL